VRGYLIVAQGMAKLERPLRSHPALPGEIPTPEVVIVAPSSVSATSSNVSLPRGLDDLDEGGAPPPLEINVQRATPTISIDDESCLEEETELQLDITTTKRHQNKGRPLSVASTTSKTNSSLLALPDNMRSMIRNLADRARGNKKGDPSITPATSVSDLRPINTGLLRRRLDSFARRPESEMDSEVDDEKTKNYLSRLCRNCPFVRSRVTKLTSHFKKFYTCRYYVDPYGKCLCLSLLTGF